jgi:hypothetical protein
MLLRATLREGGEGNFHYRARIPRHNAKNLSSFAGREVLCLRFEREADIPASFILLPNTYLLCRLLS